MKRIVLLLAITAAAVLATVSIGLAQSSVPNLLNFQGKLTDNLGNPVADGPHNFTFRIYDAAVAGTLRWTEGPVVISTSGGLFNHQLGSSTALPQTLFQDYDALYLEIEADAEIQTPRIRLISTPYTRVANNLEVRDDNTDTVAIRTIPAAHQISTYGTDGKEQIRLWGGVYGELWLHDADATNDRTVYLSANSSTGGSLTLTDDNASSTIFLHGGLTGDASVSVPSNAINSVEMLDEPGVASNAVDDAVTPILLDGTVQTILSRTIVTPASGYVLVIGTTELSLAHTIGTASTDYLGVSDVAGVFPPNQDMTVNFNSSAPSGNYHQIVTAHGLFSVGPGSHTFYFLGQRLSGVALVYDRQLSLIYFPTAYGTVTPTLAAKPGLPEESSVPGSALTAADIAAEQAEAEKFKAERIARELAEVKARMQKLEEQMQQQAVENEQ